MRGGGNGQYGPDLDPCERLAAWRVGSCGSKQHRRRSFREIQRGVQLRGEAGSDEEQEYRGEKAQGGV